MPEPLKSSEEISNPSKLNFVFENLSIELKAQISDLQGQIDALKSRVYDLENP